MHKDILSIVTGGGVIPYRQGFRPFKSVRLSDKKFAFTLSEVLITIGIIGIIAILTIPKLMQAMNNKDLVSKYLKANNVLTNAYKTAESVSGYKLSQAKSDDFKTLFEEQLNILSKDSEVCGDEICLTDGLSYHYECEEVDGEDLCQALIVDTNGANRKPNAPGKDLYKFKITEDGLIPVGEKETCGKTEGGLDCGLYVLTYHKIFDGLVDNCASYENGICVSCQNGNKGYKLENNLCVEVKVPHCSKFAPEGDDSVCVECDEKSLLTDGSCTLMKDIHCKGTEDGKTCSECMDQYTNNKGVCEKVEIQNCKEYIGDRCLDCKLGYFNSLDGKTCFKNIDHCEIQTANICNECSNNYIGNGTTSCTSCGNNEHVYNNQCYANIDNCNTPSYGDTCSSCSDGYHISTDSKICYKNVDNCTTNNNGICTSCNAGYRLDNGKCTQCTAGTYSAVGATICSTCADNTISTGGASSCSPCAANQHSQDHTKCYDNLSNCQTNVNGTCEKCNAGYRVNGTTCKQCTDGTYGADGLTCSPCSSSEKSNNDYTACIPKCEYGQYIDGLCVYNLGIAQPPSRINASQEDVDDLRLSCAPYQMSFPTESQIKKIMNNADKLGISIPNFENKIAYILDGYFELSCSSRNGLCSIDFNAYRADYYDNHDVKVLENEMYSQHYSGSYFSNYILCVKQSN